MQPEAWPDEIRSRFLESNLASLNVEPRVRDAVRAAAPRGEWVWLADGNPALRVDDTIVGAPPDSRTQMSWLSDLGNTSEGMVVVFGVGVGHALRELRARTDASIAVYEPDPGILRAALEAGPTDLGGIPIFTDLTSLKQAWPDLCKMRETASMVVTPGYPKLFPEEMRELTEAIRLLILDVSVIEETRNLRFREWISNLLENFPLLCREPPIGALSNALAGVPAFVVGAGPSLNHNAPLLREAAKKGIVIVVDVAAKAMARHGVEPHVLVALEGMNLSEHMHDLPFADRVVRAFSMSANPAMLRMKGGPVLPFFEAIPAYSTVERFLQVPAIWVGGSVSTVAFSVAERLGCSPITLVGQDLALTGGVTHADGVALQSKVRVDEGDGKVHYELSDAARKVREGTDLGEALTREQFYKAKAWGGEGEVVSTASFNSFRTWFEVVAQMIRELRPDIVFYNASEGGSHIAGYEDRTLRSVVDSLPDIDVSAAAIVALAREKRAPLDPGVLAGWAKVQAKTLRDCAQTAKELESLARDAKKRVLRGDSAISKLFKKLEALEVTLKQRMMEQPMLEGWAYKAINAAVRGAEDDARPTGDAREEAAWSLAREVDLAIASWKGAAELATRFEQLAKRATESA